ncbi:MAG: isoprenylcysteine carboxylmethyltransferase family protein [Actinomycetes bacterium]
MNRVAVPPLAWAGAAFAIQFGVSDKRPTVLSAATGALIATTSAAFALAAVSEFRRQGTSMNPLDLDHVDELVQSGPNRFSRNPMYVGMAGVLVGHAIAHRSARALAPAAVFVAIIDRLQIPVEEAMLRERFGNDFDDYAKRVPRWIGYRTAQARND